MRANRNGVALLLLVVTAVSAEAQGKTAPAATPVRVIPHAHPGRRRAVGFFERCGFARAGETQAMWVYAGGEH